jgi:chromosomal replication initiation ATPase DnaA
MDLGLLKTIDILRKGKKHNLQESEIHLVSIAVADTFSIPISALFGKSRKYPRKYAFAIWIYICHMDLKFTLTDLSAYLHCHMSTISKAKMLMEKLANDSAFDQKIHEKLAQSRQKFLQLNNTTSI